MMNENVAAAENTERDLEKTHYMEVRYALLEYSVYMDQAVLSMQNRLDKLQREHPQQAKMMSSDLTIR